MTAAKVALALGGAHRSGAWWRCRCAVHESRGATLALRDGDRGGLILYCHAGCSRSDILAELRLRGLIDGDSGIDRGRTAPAVIKVGNRGDDTARRIEAARSIWNAARDARGTPVAAYLAARGITIPLPASLRWVPSLRRPDGAEVPAMVARIGDIDGELIGVSRTWLDRDPDDGRWRRLDRRMLGRAVGGAVWLAPPTETLMVGEGVETAMAAMQATGQSAWAALSTAGLVALKLPQIVRRVIVLADHDVSGAGERAARAAAARWLAEGREVLLALPPELGTDMADVLAGRGRATSTELRDAAA
jgi:putative DNA primase/helicase